MKLTIVLLAILGVATASSIPAVKSRNTRDLKEHWDDFYALIEIDCISDIVIQYLAEDAQTQAAVEYLGSDSFKTLFFAVRESEPWQALLAYLDAGGLDVYYYDEILADIVQNGLSTRSANTKRVSARITGGLSGLWADVKASCLPLEALRALFDDKVANHEDFAALVAMFTSEEAQAGYDALKASAEWQELKEKCAAAGLDLETALEWAKNLVGYE